MKRLLRPVPLMVLALGVSLVAWVIPGESLALRGFGVRVAPSIGGVLLLIGWYSVCAVVAVIGERAGRSIRPMQSLDLPADVQVAERFDRRMLLVLTILATVGVGTVASRAGGLSGFQEALAATDANSLKQATGDGAGFSTLRYAAAVSAPIALHRLLSRRTGRIIAVWNVILLLVTVAVASRLCLMLASLVFIYLLAQRPVRARIKVSTLASIGMVVGALLVYFNYVRNARFYAANGVTNPITSNLYQVLTYLGAPFQVSLGVATRLRADWTAFSAVKDPATVLLPSFLSGLLPSGSGYVEPLRGAARYDYSVDIHPSLTTNSAFADVITSFGVEGLILSLLLVLLAAVAFGHFSLYRNYVSAVSGVVLYGFAEYWRILLFNQGILVFCCLVIAASALVAASVTPRSQV